jgi:Ca2+-binding RTX toxin-like protein
MANITGTNGNDTLTGTAADDIIKGLGGNDTIISNASGGGGNDTIDGGTGNDILDYSSSNNQIAIKLGSENNIYSLKANSSGGGNDRDNITNVETIIGSLNQPSNSLEFSSTPFNTIVDVDLSANRLTYSSTSTGISKTLTVKNFANIYGGTSGKDRLAGDDRDNIINSYRTGDVIIGSKGNDTFSGGDIDYSKLGNVVTISAVWNQVNYKYGSYISSALTGNKGAFGTDKITGPSRKIIGAINKNNTLDASATSNGGSIDLNLANNFMKVRIPNNTLTIQYELVNFVNAIGSKYDDSIVGANKSSKLTGGGGNDKITGGSKNDIITGTDSTYKGVGEIDTLTGGGGKDKFILGDKNGAYYVGNGANDYALITDFNLFQDSISIGSLKNYSFALAGNNTIDLYSGNDVKTRDLIAKIQIAGGISTISSNSKSIAGSNPNIDAIVGKINIIST